MSLVPAQARFVRSLSWVDVVLLSFLFFLIYALIGVASEWTGPFHSKTQIDLSLQALPSYAFFSLFRGFIAYFFSLVFTLFYGYIAAHSRLAEKILIPLLDILQSIPVLGFLPGVVLALVTLFPHSNVGLELACVLMIFTGQVWNMTFSFYASVKGVPKELREMAALCRLSRWDVLWRVEVPFSLNGLLWNSMLSMAGGWFFLMVVESFALGEQTFRLPGIGSYMAVAIAEGNGQAIIAGLLAMVAVIVLVDRCLWAPLVYWSTRLSTSGGTLDIPEPMILRWSKRSQLLRGYYRFSEWLQRWRESRSGNKLFKFSWAKQGSAQTKRLYTVVRVLGAGVALLGLGLGCQTLYELLSTVSGAEWLSQLKFTFYTFMRVFVAVLLGSLWAVPVGVWIGTHPKWTHRLQPFVQVLAAFPAPMIFPIVTFLLFQLGIHFEFGSVVLMLVGSQFYILFNVISGATLIPANLLELGRSFGLRGISTWREILLPAIFPSLVNGWITAAGGAWNASIVSEFLYYEGKTLAATGIGASISRAAQEGNFPILAAGIVTMVTVLVLINHFFWRRMYRLSETRFKLEVEGSR